MKNLVKNILPALIVSVMLISTNLNAQDNKEVSTMLEDKQKKEQVFSAIMQDPDLKKEMMKRMMKDAKNDSSSCKMMGNMMMDDEHMQDMMMSSMMDKAGEDDGMCKKMCMMMMDNDKMMNMMDKMKSHPPKNKDDKTGKTNMKYHSDYKHPKHNKNK
jgi:hypothetical protein